jgi:hypothetical protein
MGLSEKQNCAEGYEAIFGKKKAEKKTDEDKSTKAKTENKKKRQAKK